MWLKVTCALLLGYLSLSRTFAYLGIPPWKAFIGEAFLVLFVVAGPRVGRMKWPWIAWRVPALRRLLGCYKWFLAYGVAEVLRGILAGNPVVVTFRDLAFNVYPVYFLLGLWAGATRPELLPKLLRKFAWFNGVYGVLYLFVLARVEWFVPGVSQDVTPVTIFPQPIYSVVALLGLLVYEGSLTRSWYLLLLNGFVMLGMQFRTEWLAFSIGVVAWLVVTHQSKRVLQVGLVLACLVSVLYVTNARLPVPEQRAGGEVSVKSLVDRGMAVFRADLSDQRAAAGLGGVDSQEATFVFRTVWWLAIWNSVHSDLRTTVLGHGYGFPLGDLVPYLEGEFIRTPHNQFFYALGYTGWVGVLLFGLFQFEIFRLLWKVYRTDGKPFGMVFWISMMAYGMFFPLGETPYGAIPFYLVIGWCASPLLRLHESSGRARAPHVSAKFAGMNPSGATAAAS